MTLGHVFVCRMHSAPTAGLLLTIKIQRNFCPSGKLNVKDNELEDMLKEASGPINFTMFLNLFGEKLHGKAADRSGMIVSRPECIYNVLTLNCMGM